MNYEDIRKEKLEELKKRQMEEQGLAEAEVKIDATVKSMLSEEARIRLNNVKLVNQQLYLKAVQLLLYLQRSGNIQGKISEGEVKQVLEKLRSKKEIRIRRK